MKELNEMITKLKENPKPINVKEEWIPDGFNKMCDCMWIYGQPFYTCGISIIKSNVDPFGHKSMFKKFIECDRWFCPVCNIELVRNKS
jgi:hypothetical protein